VWLGRSKKQRSHDLIPRSISVHAIHPVRTQKTPEPEKTHFFCVRTIHWHGGKIATGSVSFRETTVIDSSA
jgi:hypothetical protein